MDRWLAYWFLWISGLLPEARSPVSAAIRLSWESDSSVLDDWNFRKESKPGGMGRVDGTFVWVTTGAVNEPGTKSWLVRYRLFSRGLGMEILTPAPFEHLPSLGDNPRVPAFPFLGLDAGRALGNASIK